MHHHAVGASHRDQRAAAPAAAEPRMNAGHVELAGFVPVRSPIQSTAVRRVWDPDTMVELPAGGQGTWDGALTAEHAETVRDAVQAAEGAVPAGRRVLLFYGVGTGNPSVTAWGNNTVTSAEAAVEKVIGHQRNPGFVQAEIDKPESAFFVVALNFNYESDSPAFRMEPEGDRGVRLDVNTRFPLAVEPAERPGRVAFEELKCFAARVTQDEGRFALMNAVNQFDYASLLEMVPTGQSYLKSYGSEPGGEAAYSKVSSSRGTRSARWLANKDPQGFATTADAFL